MKRWYYWYKVKHRLKNIGKYINLKYRRSFLLRNANNIKNDLLRKLSKAILIFPLLMVNTWIIASLNNKDLGISQWIHLKKTKP